MSVVTLERLIGAWIAAEPASLTVHAAIDFVTGSPDPDFARLADRNGEIFALIERRSGESRKAFRGTARAAAEARGAAKLVFAQLSAFRIGDKAAAKRPDDLLDCVAYGCALGFEEQAYGRLRTTR